MQAKQVESKGLKRVYTITVPHAQIEEQMDSELKAAGKKVKIPGFRPGNIPMNILKQRYGKSVEADVVRQSINRSTNELLKDKNYRPATEPVVDINEFKEGGDFTFTVKFEIFPEVPEMKFDDISLDRPVVEVGEAELQDAMNTIAKRSSTTERAKEGSKAKSGQVVVIDFAGSIDGELFEGGTASDFRLELGSGQFIDGFEKQLEGAKEGEEVTVEVTFPQNYHSKSLAGKPASFAVTVKEIHDKKPAEINEEFATSRGFENLDALKKAISDQIRSEYDQAIRQRLKKQLFDVLEEKCTIDLPPTMVESEFNSIWERVKEAKEAGDETLTGKSDDELKKEYGAIAERRVKLGILLAEVGNRNKLQVTQEELGRAVMQQASQFPGQEKMVMEFYKKNPERLADMRGPILEEKAVELILSKVTYNDTNMTAEELLKEEAESDGQSGKKTAKKKAPAKKKAKEA